MELKHQLTPKLKQLRLSGILQTLDSRHRQAVDGKWSYVEFLERLLEDEVERRQQKQLSLRLRRSGVNTAKTIETFDFDFNPAINRQQILAPTAAWSGASKPIYAQTCWCSTTSVSNPSAPRRPTICMMSSTSATKKGRFYSPATAPHPNGWAYSGTHCLVQPGLTVSATGPRSSSSAVTATAPKVANFLNRRCF